MHFDIYISLIEIVKIKAAPFLLETALDIPISFLSIQIYGLLHEACG